MQRSGDYAAKCRIAVDVYRKWYDDLDAHEQFRVLQILALNEVHPAPPRQVIIVG